MLTELNLQKTSITSRGVKDVLTLLHNQLVKRYCSPHYSYSKYILCTQVIRILNLADNDVGDEGAKHIASFLKVNNVSRIFF